jgi:hypothetical protein
LTLVGSLLLLLTAFAFIFFVARGCVATQESTQVRKYVTSADSLLSESANLGNEQLQGVLQNAGGDPAGLDGEALVSAANRSENLYLQALTKDEVPPEFGEAHHYLISALGIRERATAQLADAAYGDGFNEALAEAVADYRLSDGIVRDHYFPAVQNALRDAGQQRDGGYLEEPEPFMDYEETSFEVATVGGGAVGAAEDDPNALHGVEVAAVEVGGETLYPGGNVVLTGADEPVFSVTVTNGGEIAEAAVPVEVILNTRAERQAQKATIGRIAKDGGVATVEVSGFRPGELDETADVTVEVGPVKYEDYLENNTLKGTVTFGL